MIKVGFFLDNVNIEDISFAYPEKGNPGCGGTEFLIASLPYYFNKFSKQEHRSVVYTSGPALSSVWCESVKIQNVCEAALRAVADGCDFFIYRPLRHSQDDLLELFSNHKIIAIPWLHVTPTDRHLRKMAKVKNIKALVCVEHEQHESIRDAPIFNQLTYIVNGFDFDGFQPRTLISRKSDLVVHVGALEDQKDFRLLAKAWPYVIKRCPWARLVVIGSSQVYNQNVQLGSLGIASKRFENLFIRPYLCDYSGNVIPSVKFLGKLGSEKNIILAEASIGIPTPSGQNENCPGVVLEMLASGVPVVSTANTGLLDTVQNFKTGILGKHYDDLAGNICFLLENSELIEEYGVEGKRFVKSRYDYKKIVDSWFDLFSCLRAGKSIKPKPLKTNIFKHQKFVVYINIPFQFLFGSVMPWPSTREVKSFVRWFLSKKLLIKFLP